MSNVGKSYPFNPVQPDQHPENDVPLDVSNVGKLVNE